MLEADGFYRSGELIPWTHPQSGVGFLTPGERESGTRKIVLSRRMIWWTEDKTLLWSVTEAEPPVIDPPFDHRQAIVEHVAGDRWRVLEGRVPKDLSCAVRPEAAAP